jgi:putative endopeptidase
MVHLSKLMSARCSLFWFTVLCATGLWAQSPNQPVLPYSPSLNLESMDRSVDPCVDFYHYSCGGWQKQNPIPPDQTSWSVYSKLYQDNLNFLRGILEAAAKPTPGRDAVTREIGDFYAACMDEAAANQRGISPLKPQLDAIAALESAQQIAPIVSRLQLAYARDVLFSSGSSQDPDDSEQEIAELAQGGLGLPDRDYYVKTDAKMQEARDRYVQHLQKVFELAGENSPNAKQDAATVMRLETALAKASLTRVEQRDPYKLKHKMSLAELTQLVPNFDWAAFYRNGNYPKFALLNVEEPGFFQELNALLASEPIENWKIYLRSHVVDAASPYLSTAFVDENFEFYRKYLHGAKEQQPRWKRCVSYTDHNLDDALGQAYVSKVFSPELKASTLEMVERIEHAMELRIGQLDWMSPETKQQALTKLHGIRNKIGYPDRWRDYSSIKLSRDNFFADIQGTGEFESHRQIAKIGKPVDHGEWQIPPPTVDAYYDPQMNDINFPAGVLQPPLYDPKIDAAPNYGNTGGTIGHELTHGFDDEGSQFDAKGNLRNWWTKEDREKFDSRTKCVEDQYAQYIVVDDIHINSALTLGEDVADLGGEILAYMAWQDATKGENLQATDGLTPDQRFFIGFAQWDCANQRPEDLRVSAITNPHSPPEHRINGVVVNMPEFAHAFSCKQGQPMTKPAQKICKVW